MTNYPEFQPDLIQSNGLEAFFIESRLPIQSVLLGLFSTAIAEFEGWFITDPPSISRRHNNPGNLRPIGASSGFRTFPTPLDGWKALIKQIVININRGLTLREFFLGKQGVYPGYAPLGDNPADVMENYIAFVAKRMNIRDDVILARYFTEISNYSDFQPLGYFLVWTYEPFYAQQ